MSSDSRSTDGPAVGVEARFLNALSVAFHALSWGVRERERLPNGFVDLLIEHGGVRYAIELKVSREARRNRLEALLADAILRARHAAPQVHAQPLAIVAAPNLSPALLEHLSDYADRFGEGCAWGAIDLSGIRRLHGPDLPEIGAGVVPRSPRRSSAGLHQPTYASADPFSNLGQWLIKVLFAAGMPERYLSVPRNPIFSSRQLAVSAGVSTAHAARQIAELRRLGYVSESEEGLRLQRVEDLLDRWRAANRRPSLEIRARWILRPRDPLAHLQDALRRYSGTSDFAARSPSHWWFHHRRAALGMYAASRALGLGFVEGAALHAYIESSDDSDLEELGLAPVGPGERVDVFVRLPRFPEAVFRAAIMAEASPVADALQCWLDLVDDPVRGAEQAQEIWRRVVGPAVRMIERGEW